ncbi:MAG: RecQ family ATP-dependent DNA helicase [Bacteroidales bacterium]|nr:RecQ family ATP-dependent DNA helicase [Bacteroidales bacterium]
MGQEAREILAKYWGFSQFRPLQEEIIDSVLAGKDTFALLPTGGGKSLTFQIPALIQDGCCLVITPLISLMKDQVDHLKRLGIFARALYTGMHFSEIESVFSEAIHGNLKFLYISPERLLNKNFQWALAKMNVNLIAVDEAHCISQWGYNFRPPYLQIAEIRNFFPDTSLLALTATATPKVVEDILEKLNFKIRNVFQSSFERKNLAYRIFNEGDKTGRLIELLKKKDGSAIVYVRNRKKTRELTEILVKNNISATFYHAGLDAKIRIQRQQQWTRSQVRVMVATNAFGMGIDKPNVRQVIHYNLPDCLESYFQEAGRAGRDRKEAVASLFFNNHDIGRAKQQLTESYPEVKKIRDIYNALGNYLQIPIGAGKDMGYNFNIVDFTKQYNFGLITTYSTLKLLEKEGFVAYRESEERFSKMFVRYNNEELYRFMVENPKFEVLIKQILRSYGGVFTDYVAIDEKVIAKRTEMKPESVVQGLTVLSKAKVINYIQLKSSPQLFYNTDRLPKEHIGFSAENYDHLKQAASRRLEAMIDFLTNDKTCRSVQLLAYFGEKKAKRCGICDVCQNMNKMDLNEMEYQAISQQIQQLLSEKSRNLYELIPLISDYPEDKIVAVVRWLIDNQSIMRLQDEKLVWQNQMGFDF